MSRMLYKHISKRKIKKYIENLEKIKEKVSDSINRAQKENKESEIQLYDLTDQYLLESRIEGQIFAATYILNNC